MAVIILNSKPKPKRTKYIQAKPVQDPKRIEWDARRTLKNITGPIKEDIRVVIESIKNDPSLSAADIGRRLEKIKNMYQAQFDMMADVISKNWVDSVNRYNYNKVTDEIRDALGIDVSSIINENIKEDLDVMMWESSNYIKTIPSELTLRVADRVLQHYKGEQLPENRTLAAQIKEEFKVTDGRAKVLARDQTAKMNTSLSAIRQNEIGIDMYIWRTMQDERVVGTPGGRYRKINQKHKNHYIMEGKICKWADPTVYSDDKGKTWKKRTADMPHNHPGDDIMCRCRPAPYIDIEKLKVKWQEM